MQTIAQKVRQSVKDLFVRSRPSDWDRRIFGYARKYLARHVWRVGREMDLDDLLQDAYILFLKLQERYPDVSDRHFMALWKVSLRNWMHNLAKRRTRRREESIGERDFSGTIESNLEWQEHRRIAPLPVKMLLWSVGTRKRDRPRMGCFIAGRETTNNYLCRMAGVPDSTPLRDMFELWLGSSR